MIAELVKQLEDRSADTLIYRRTISASPARYGELDRPLPPRLECWLDSQHRLLYTHQVEAIERIRRGEEIILTTPTASGKSLAFNLAVTEGLLAEPNATALYLYPLKALTQDQLVGLRALDDATGSALRPAIYDGDTPQHRRASIRDEARIILSNPHAIHQYLPWHARWRSFWSGLRYVVVDEAHTYRGIFGANVAYLLRRIRRVAERYGGDPQFVLASATVANAAQLGERLVNAPVQVIDKSGSPEGERTFLFWNAALNGDRSVHRQTSDLLAAHIRAGLQTLCFTLSRRTAELVGRWAGEGGLQHQVTSYRAGYRPEERRALERAFADGELRGIASTTALELGIDIGGLDGVIISGYPGTISSTWQMAGRAGRGAKPSVVTLVGFENPLDQYFMRHPEALFDRAHEHAVIDLDNQEIRLAQLTCAAAELPIDPECDVRYFRAPLEGPLQALADAKLVQQTPAGWVFRGRSKPVETIGLEQISKTTIQLIDGNGSLLESLDLRRAYESAYPGAVLLRRGETYLVTSLDLDEGVARATPQAVDYFTESLRSSHLEVLSPSADHDLGDGFTLCEGEVRVTERFTGYRARHGDRTLSHHELDLPPLEMETTALWISFPDTLRSRIEGSGLYWAAGLHAAEHALIAMMPLLAMCDRWDVGGLSTPFDPGVGGPAIFIYDGYPGGIGISHKACDTFAELVKQTLELVRDCPCETGCPSCIYSPKCGERNQTLDKRAAIEILRALTDRTADQRVEATT